MSLVIERMSGELKAGGSLQPNVAFRIVAI